MGIVVTDSGKQWLASCIFGLNPSQPPTLVYHLFQNNATLSRTTTTANLTAANFDGYSSQTSANWSFITISSADNSAQFKADQMLWTRTGNSQPQQQVYGYWVEEAGQNYNVLFAEVFEDGPYDMSRVGDTISLVPEFHAKSEFNN